MKSFKEILLEVRYKALHKPVTTFHGSKQGKISDFQIPGKGTNNYGGLLGNEDVERHGAFFSDNPAFSKNYGDVHKYHLHIKNPYKFHEYTHLDFANSIDAFGPDRDKWIAAKYKKHNWQLFDGELGKHFVGWLKSQGHDSAQFHEYDEKDDAQSNTTVVFDKNHIKPAHTSSELSNKRLSKLRKK